jgi:formimidoylglutamate deiminase
MNRTIRVGAAFVDGAWHHRVAFHLQHGRITRREALSDHGPTDHDVLIPGIHNAHSHAFQWAMRGQSHALVAGHEHDDFWAWRERMYALAERLGPDDVYAIASELYRVMRRAGYVSVAEFHYLHHEADRDREHPSRMAEAHAAAARDARLQLTLVPVAYHRGGAGRPAAGAQQRFVFDAVDDYLDYVDRLRGAVAGEGADVAYGAHSIRAVPAAWLRPIAAAADAAQAPLHIHACEQPRELQECLSEYGCTPITLLEDHAFLGPRTVVVHGTHLEDGDLERLRAARSIVCACPSTERDLGDGFLLGLEMLQAGVRVCVGSDSHAVVDAAEELALLEGHARLVHRRRNVLTMPPAVLRPAETLLRWGAVDGAAALGLQSGRLEVGERFDALAWDVPRKDLAATDNALAATEWLDRWLFAQPRTPPDRVYVAGEA